MALRKILTKGDELLTMKAKPVTSFDARLRELLDDMRETLDEAQGAGLAGPQVGVLRRLFIIYDGETLMEFINPEIVETEGEREIPEGCLSLPGKQGFVIRPVRVKVRAQDRSGKPFEFEAEGNITAQALCHEYDHLDGILYDSKVTRWDEEQ